VSASVNQEFATRLRALGVIPRRDDVWLMVGRPTRAAAWKLHVSATLAGVERLFERVVPCLVRHGTHFKMVADRQALLQLSAGNYGAAQIGKVLTVYPRDDAEAVVLARELIEYTRELVGPRIATDLHLGAAVYTRYGAVRPRISYDRFGERTELIPDGRGNWVTDLRSVPFRCPHGVAVPFPLAPEPAVAGNAKRGLLGGRYFVTDVLHPAVAGSVLRALDLRDVRRPVVCVLKQARPYCSEDERGRDRRARFRHEAAILARLRGLKGIAAAGEYFEDEEIGYLPITYVPGQALAEVVHQRVRGHSWVSLRAQVRCRLLGFASQLVRRLRSAHARGVIHRDIAPGNVWITADDHVYLLDWESAYVMGSRTPAFRLGTPGFSELGYARRTPTPRDDWQACARVLAFMLTGLDPAAVIHGRRRELAARLAELTGLHGARLNELLAGSMADDPSSELDAAVLLRAIASLVNARPVRRPPPEPPLFTLQAHESAVANGLEIMTAALRARLDRLCGRRTTPDAADRDAHSGVAGMLYVLAAAHGARVAHLDPTLGARAVRVLARATVRPDLAGLVHGRAGCALAIAAAVQAGCVSSTDALRRYLAGAFTGCIDWPDVTHGAAGQGLAALACARRLRLPELAAGATACAAYLVRTQNPEGTWTLPEGAPGVSGERYTGFAHGAAGIMGFLGSYAALAGDAAADLAWRRAEAWLVSRARRGRGGRWQWPQSVTSPTAGVWWCHGAPGIALGWLCVAEAQGIAAIAEEHLRRALIASTPGLRSDSVGQCHGLAGIGEMYLDASRVLQEACWQERAADIARVLVAMCRRRSPQPWHYLTDEPAAGADGLMLGTAGVLHFLLRYQHPGAVTNAPLLG
jgi:tRNA A-37 threonylcarbamoyl transferase component Bud32